MPFLQVEVQVRPFTLSEVVQDSNEFSVILGCLSSWAGREQWTDQCTQRLPLGAILWRTPMVQGLFSIFPFSRHPPSPPQTHTHSWTSVHPQLAAGVSPHKLRFWGGSRQSIRKKHLDCSDADGDPDDTQGHARFICFLGGKTCSQSSNNHLG